LSIPGEKEGGKAPRKVKKKEGLTREKRKERILKKRSLSFEARKKWGKAFPPLLTEKEGGGREVRCKSVPEGVTKRNSFLPSPYHVSREGGKRERHGKMPTHSWSY